MNPDPSRPEPNPATARSSATATVAQRVFGAFERFLHVEAVGGIVLLAAAVIALLWANSPWAASYHALWHTPLTFGVGALVFAQPLHFWINDGLMTIFFLVVGLEIRRELDEGALSSVRQASFPVAAALGGVLAPALIYVALNTEPAARQGWAIPTATDIAFAVGILALLGRRVPSPVRVLLLALAIIDDIVAILIIAFFYSSGVKLLGFVIVAAGALGVLLLQRLGARSALAYVLPGAVIWLGMLQAGVHPTLTGIVLGLMTPVVSATRSSVAAASQALDDFQQRVEEGHSDKHHLIHPIKKLQRAQLELLPPVTRVEAILHPWVAYGVMPLFALANAGVSFAGLGFGDPASRGVAFGVGAGLVLGKPLGIVLATLAAVRLKWCELPSGVTWPGVLVVGCLGGIGFTMSIFIATLAFADDALLGAAKLAVLLASSAAGVIGLAVGALVFRRDAASSPSAAG
jgi:Na+:H+ antiporter, NhaA family